MNSLSQNGLAVAGANLWPELLKNAFILCIVLLILVGFLLLLKKYLNYQTGGGEHGYMKMLASHYFSQRERLILMDVLGEKILIGVTAQGINYLAKITEGVSGSDLKAIITESGMFAIRNGRECVETEDMENAITKVLLHQKKSNDIVENMFG